MVSSRPCDPPRFRWSLTLCAFLLALAHAPVRGAEAEGRLHPVISRGTGYAEVAGQRVPLPWSRTSAGPLVALQPLVPLFGGELEIGPLRQSHTLRVQEIEAVLGPDSGSMVLDHRIVPIAPAPAVGDGGLQVPLEVLERTWGDALGWEIAWDGVTGTPDGTSATVAGTRTRGGSPTRPGGDDPGPALRPDPPLPDRIGGGATRGGPGSGRDPSGGEAAPARRLAGPPGRHRGAPDRPRPRGPDGGDGLRPRSALPARLRRAPRGPRGGSPRSCRSGHLGSCPGSRPS